MQREREGGKAPERDSKTTFARPSPLSTPLDARAFLPPLPVSFLLPVIAFVFERLQTLSCCIDIHLGLFLGSLSVVWQRFPIPSFALPMTPHSCASPFRSHRTRSDRAKLPHDITSCIVAFLQTNCSNSDLRHLIGSLGGFNNLAWAETGQERRVCARRRALSRMWPPIRVISDT